MFELAGSLGVDPHPFTLRELVWMARGKRCDDWSHTSELLALIANAHRDTAKRPEPYSSRDFNPHAPKRKPPLQSAPITILRDAFVPRKKQDQ